MDVDSGDSDDEPPPLLGPEAAPAGPRARVIKSAKPKSNAAVPALATPPVAAQPKGIGQAVIVGLKARPEHNGKAGVVLRRQANSDRWQVRLDDGSELALREANLQGFTPPTSSAAAPTSSAAAMPVLSRKKDADTSGLRMPEVQQEMSASAAAGSVGGDASKWMNDGLLKQIAADPLLRKAFTDPEYAEVMAALQKDPQAAMQKYGHIPEMQEFLKKFMKLMGDHFTKLADAKDAEGAKGAAPTPPVSAEEQKAQADVALAMTKPEVAAILQEPAVQEVIRKLQAGRSIEVEKEMRHPEMMRKLRVLAAAGLINIEFR